MMSHVRTRDSTAWKAEALSEVYATRPSMWIDDQNLGCERALQVPDSLMVDPDPWGGLTVAQTKKVDAWVDAHTAP